MAVVTTDYSSLTALVDALVAAPNYRDLNDWRGAYEELFDDVTTGAFVPGVVNPTSITGTTPHGSISMMGSSFNFTPNNNFIVTNFAYTQIGGNVLQIGAGDSLPIKINVTTGAVSGHVTQLSYSAPGHSIILSGTGPASGTGGIVLDHLGVDFGTFQMNVVGTGVTLNNVPTSPLFLTPTSGTINEIHITIGANHLDATGLSISAATFYNADTHDEIAALVNSVFGGNNLHTAQFDNQTLMGGGGNDVYDFGSFPLGEVSELANGGTDLVKSSASWDLALHGANVENASLTGGADASLTGNELNNLLTGNGGNNSLIGGAGNDTLVGGAGNDSLEGDAGKDSLAGGAGDDIYIVNLINLTAATLGLADTLGAESLGGGHDYLLISTATVLTPNTTAFTLVLGANFEDLSFSGTASNLLINATGNALDDAIVGNDGANLIKGMDGNDTLMGGGGNDTLDGGAGNDVLYGGAENDVFVVAQSGDVIDLTDDSGVDTVLLYVVGGNNYNDLSAKPSLENVTWLGTGAVTLTGNGESNLLIGGAGNDTLDGGTGADVMNGGGGNDSYYVDNAGDQVVDSAGTLDTVIASISGVALGAGVEKLVLMGGGTGTGNGLNNVLQDGGGGAVTLIGGLGNDTYNIGVGDVADETTGGGGKDLVVVTLPISGDAYTLGGGLENLTVLGGESGIIGVGNELANVITGSDSMGDSLAGGAGNDTLLGLGSNDTLDGGAGKDSMVGGAGDDSFFVNLINPTLTTVALEDSVGELAGGGTDTLLFSSEGLGANTTAFAYTLAANIENLDMSGVEAIAKVNVTGNALNNGITGSDGDNKLDGAAGNDTLDGGAGNDTVLGGAGNDSLGGGADGDSLFGGLGNDTLAGGAGNDNFVLDAALGAANVDTIADFTGGADHIVLDQTIFAKLATALAKNALAADGNLQTLATGEYIRYEAGNLFYDADSTGAGLEVKIAVVTGSPALTGADFLVIP